MPPPIVFLRRVDSAYVRAGRMYLKIAAARVLRLYRCQLDDWPLLAIRPRGTGELDQRGIVQCRGWCGIWLHLRAAVPAARFHRGLHSTAVRIMNTNSLQLIYKVLRITVVFFCQGGNRREIFPLPIVKEMVLYMQICRMSTPQAGEPVEPGLHQSHRPVGGDGGADPRAAYGSLMAGGFATSHQ